MTLQHCFCTEQQDHVSNTVVEANIHYKKELRPQYGVKCFIDIKIDKKSLKLQQLNSGGDNYISGKRRDALSSCFSLIYLLTLL